MTLFLRNTASLLSDPVATGTRLRFNVVAIDDVPGAELVPSQKVSVTPDPSQADAHGDFAPEADVHVVHPEDGAVG